MMEFERIKYANCWEDADVLLSAVPNFENQRKLSIASGGDNSFSLLTKNPCSVVLVDMNRTQLHLCQLKMVAFEYLTHSQLLEFLGVNSCQDRKNIYKSLRVSLTEEAKLYWDSHLDLIEEGVLFVGKFEQYFRLFRTKVMPWIHSEKRISELLSTKIPEEQERYYFEVWNTWRWRFLFKLFFSKAVMGRYGRTKEYLNQVEVQVGKFVFEQAENHLKRTFAQHNYFLHFIFKGRFYPQLPHYLRLENFDSIKNQIHKIEFLHGTAQEALNKHESFDFCNFSNIFEYLSMSQFEEFETLLRAKTKQGSVVCYWNLMVDRMFSSQDKARYHELNLNFDDKGFFYKRFVAEKVL